VDDITSMPSLTPSLLPPPCFYSLGQLWLHALMIPIKSKNCIKIGMSTHKNMHFTGTYMQSMLEVSFSPVAVVEERDQYPCQYPIEVNI
jgi:hypothetical protein